MNGEFNLLEVVIANTNLPQEQVLKGDLGTIVEIYDTPQRAYEVEFVNPDGTTRALLTLLPNQIRRLVGSDVSTTRSLSMAI